MVFVPPCLTLKMMSEYCSDNTSVVFTEEWDELHNARKQFWKKGTVVWLLYREEDNVKVWNKLIYEGFIPEFKTVYRLDSRNEFIMRAVYAPVEISQREGEKGICLMIIMPG